ncbi:Hypothetical predicted protein, partial [Drosophila guanche]
LLLFFSHSLIHTLLHSAPASAVPLPLPTFNSPRPAAYICFFVCGRCVHNGSSNSFDHLFINPSTPMTLFTMYCNVKLRNSTLYKRVVVLTFDNSSLTFALTLLLSLYWTQSLTSSAYISTKKLVNTEDRSLIKSGKTTYDPILRNDSQQCYKMQSSTWYPFNLRTQQLAFSRSIHLLSTG